LTERQAFDALAKETIRRETNEEVQKEWRHVS
jgi:hypothetical protein